MKAKKEEVYVALLRGVNVGGHNKLPMKALASLCEAHGCLTVQTYIQSGNVVFRAGAKAAAAFPAALQARIKEEFGFETTLILRTAAELKSVTESNPFLKKGVDPKFLHVLFLAAKPNLVDVVKLDPVCDREEAFSLNGREVYLYLPYGGGRSKMASYAYDKVLHTACSTRNWQTVTKLLAMAQKAS